MELLKYGYFLAAWRDHQSFKSLDPFSQCGRRAGDEGYQTQIKGGSVTQVPEYKFPYLRKCVGGYNFWASACITWSKPDLTHVPSCFGVSQCSLTVERSSNWAFCRLRLANISDHWSDSWSAINWLSSCQLIVAGLFYEARTASSISSSLGIGEFSTSCPQMQHHSVDS